MGCGLQIHKQAVMIEYYLSQAVNKVQRQRNSSLADIMMVYDRPIHLTAEILSELQDKVRNETELRITQDIRTRYCTYQRYTLSQLDEEICERLVDDLRRLSE